MLVEDVVALEFEVVVETGEPVPVEPVPVGPAVDVEFGKP